MDKHKFRLIYEESRNGANDFYFNPLYAKLAYSDGMRDLAENGCWWLLDIIGTECLKPLRKSAGGMATVEVTVTATAKANIELLISDDSPPIWSRQIEWTDMPEGKWVFLLVDEIERFALTLPSEY